MSIDARTVIPPNIGKNNFIENSNFEIRKPFPKGIPVQILARERQCFERQ